MQPQSPEEQPQTNPMPPETTPPTEPPVTVSPDTVPEQPVPTEAVTSPVATPAPLPSTSKSKLPIIAAVAIAGLLLVGGGIFALSANKASERKHAQEISDALSKSKAGKTADSEETKAAPLSKETVAVNKTIRDDVMGVTINVESYSIGEVAIPAKYKANNSDKTVVLVKLTAKSDGKYAGATNLLTKVLGKGAEYGTPTSLSDTDIQALGYTVYDNTKPVNNMVSGYKAYWVDTDKLEKLTFIYKRQAAGVLGSDKTISAQEYPIELK